MKVIKRNGQVIDFDLRKIDVAIRKAFESEHEAYDPQVVASVQRELEAYEATESISVETIQDMVERALMEYKHFAVAKAFILYRHHHEEARFIRERIDYMDRYSNSMDNAASSSETDANANVTMKNVANLEGEV